MASFLSKSFAHKGYAAFRPTYAAELYRTVLAYHEGFSDSRRSLSVDLGTGHGLVTRELSPHFHRVIGTDPSAGMVSQARELSPVTSYPNVEFHQFAAESLPFLKGPQSTYSPGGGSSRTNCAPSSRRSPSGRRPSGSSTSRPRPVSSGGRAKMTLGAMEEYTRTWSSFHQWQQRFPSAHRRGPYGDGEGDVIDRMMDAIREAESAFQVSEWKEKEVDVEWGSALILARRREE
ncbi:hypothetical protein ETB97_000206 [Aspergillus alliaceus]|uniref:Methyltransferase domain-containing protein n=1 Tax=Petromyces alliaceus TaxID=209559 RepID=A0A8H6AD20_PETAA|nr:hypothetical protein ETB97_000206 [Aspergillus burnettii]